MFTYSVIQSDRNIFCGDVVLDSVNMASRDEGSILDQLYIFVIFYHNDLIKKK